MYLSNSDQVPKQMQDPIASITDQIGPSVATQRSAVISPSFFVIEITTVPIIMKTVPKYSQNFTYSPIYITLPMSTITDPRVKIELKIP